MMTRRYLTLPFAALVAILCLLLVCDGAHAQGKAKKQPKPKKEKPEPKKKPEPTTLSGTISVTKDDAGKIKSVSLNTAGGETYNILLDKTGKEAANLDGKTVEVTGIVAEKGNAKNLKIAKMKEAGGAAAEGEKKDKPKAGGDQE